LSAETSEPSEVVTGKPRPRFFQSLRWVIIGFLVLLELVSGLVLEPWADAAGGRWESFFEHYSWILRFGVLGAVVWLTFAQLERIEAVLVRQRDRIRDLYHETRQQRDELQTLYQASLEMSRGGDDRDILRTIVEVAARLAHADYGALAEFDESERVVEFVTVGVDPRTAAIIGLPPTHRGLLARLSERSAVRVDDVASEPDMGGFPPGHPQIRGFLGVPIRYEGELFGHLYLANPEHRTFSERDARMLEMFAHQAAVAIGRSRVDRQRRELLRAEEHRRVAVELHDGALQALYAVGIQLNRAKRQGVTSLTETMTTANAIEAVERAMAAIRGELSLLTRRSHGVSEWAQLHKHVADVAALYGVTLSWTGPTTPVLSRDVASALAPVLAELVANAARHGRATTVTIEVHGTLEQLAVRVGDDGAGLDGDAVMEEGTGLREARRRLARVDGELALAPAGPGFEATIVVPSGHVAALNAAPSGG